MRERNLRIPAAETVFAVIRAKHRLVPGLAVVGRHIDLGDAAIAPHRNAAQRDRPVERDRLPFVEARDPTARNHLVDRDGREILLARPHVRAWSVRDLVRLGHPVTVVGCGKHLDVVQHLDPIGRIPAGYDQPDREAVEERHLFAVHPEGEHHFAVACVVDRQ